MSKIEIKTKDVIWNYIGTFMSMFGSFILLPFLVYWLDASELGLWYVFLAISNLTQLFEFGFNPTFSRNIVYCVSGATGLTKEGPVGYSTDGTVDFWLLKTVMKTSRVVFGVISAITLIGVATFGTIYIASITSALSSKSYWVAWGIFAVAIFFNLYYLYSLTFLRGLGDIAAENKAKSGAKIAQLIVSLLTLCAGWGLIGAALGYLANGVVLRIMALYFYRCHKDIQAGLESVKKKVCVPDLIEVLHTVSFVAARDGFVQLANYVATQASSLVCSTFLTLAQTGQYSIYMQFASAAQMASCTYARSYFPAFQSSYASGDIESMKRYVSRGFSSYFILFVLMNMGVVLVVFPIAPLFKPNFISDTPLYLALSTYYFLYNNHSLACNYIVGMNRIPYCPHFIISSCAGVVLQAVLIKCGFGQWGLVLGQALAQIVCNNWFWPRYLAKMLNSSFFTLLNSGFNFWMKEASSFLCAKKRK